METVLHAAQTTSMTSPPHRQAISTGLRVQRRPVVVVLPQTEDRETTTEVNMHQQFRAIAGGKDLLVDRELELDIAPDDFNREYVSDLRRESPSSIQSSCADVGNGERANSDSSTHTAAVDHDDRLLRIRTKRHSAFEVYLDDSATGAPKTLKAPPQRLKTMYENALRQKEKQEKAIDAEKNRIQKVTSLMSHGSRRLLLKQQQGLVEHAFKDLDCETEDIMPVEKMKNVLSNMNISAIHIDGLLSDLAQLEMSTNAFRVLLNDALNLNPRASRVSIASVSPDNVKPSEHQVAIMSELTKKLRALCAGLNSPSNVCEGPSTCLTRTPRTLRRPRQISPQWLEMQRLRQEAREQKEEAARKAHCSFRPQINSRSAILATKHHQRYANPTDLHSPAGNETGKRLTSWEMREMAALAECSFKPDLSKSFLKRPLKKPVCSVTLTLGDHVRDRVDVYNDTSATQLAKNFVTKHGLPVDEVEEIAQHISQQIKVFCESAQLSAASTAAGRDSKVKSHRSQVLLKGSVTISGDTTPGSVLRSEFVQNCRREETVHVPDFDGAVTPSQVQVLSRQWLRVYPDESGWVVDMNTSQYRVQDRDVGCFLMFRCGPIRADGTCQDWLCSGLFGPIV